VFKLKFFIKVKSLKPILQYSDYADITLYTIESEDWRIEEIHVSGSVLDKMLVDAQNIITILDTRGLLNDKLGLVEIETTGLKVTRCDGRGVDAKTLLYPIPKPVRRIVFLKKKGELLEPVHSVDLTGELWVYDSVLNIKNSDFDAILVETIDDKRVVLKHELSTSTLAVKPGVKTKKKRKRARRKKSKVVKKKGRRRKKR